MNPPWMEQLSESQTAAVENAISLGELTSLNAAAFTRHEMELLGRGLEACVEEMQEVGHATTLQQLFDRQRELATACGPRIVALASDQLQLMLEMQRAWTTWWHDRMASWPRRPRAASVRPARRHQA